MKFTMTRKHRYWWPVKVAVPNPELDKAGEWLEMNFRMRFAALPREEADAISEKLKKSEGADIHADLMRVVKDWDEDIIDADGKPIPFSPEAFAELLQISWYRMAVYRAWGDSLIGEAARRGN